MREEQLTSVVVPVYNSEATIEACIRSILGQTVSRLELIVIDDGSTDGSGDICDRLARQDARMKVIHQPNKGRTEARHVGVQNGSGEWVCFVDSDDMLKPEALARLTAATSSDTDIVFGNAKSLIPQGDASPATHHYPLQEFRHLAVRAEGTIGVPWGSLYRRSVLTPWLFNLPRHIMMGEDYIFWLRLVFTTQKPVALVYENVYCKGDDHTSNSFRWSADYCYELNELRKNSIPDYLHREFMADMLADRLENMYSVALWTPRCDWQDSPYYRELLADLSANGIQIAPKGRLFLALPSLRLRRLYNWVSRRLRVIG